MAERALVETLIEDPRWEALDIEALAETAARAALHGAGEDPSACEISLLVADDARIAALNEAFRGKPVPTNVLSWPSDDPPQPGEPRFLGDMALAWDTCLREAEAAGVPMPHHVTHLVVHGVLHLLGHDHETDADAATMEALETKILARLGVADPYE